MKTKLSTMISIRLPVIVLMLAIVIFLSACKKVNNTPVSHSPTIPELNSELQEPKLRVFQFIDNSKEKPFICLTRIELIKLLEDLNQLKANRRIDELTLQSQVSYCNTITKNLIR